MTLFTLNNDIKSNKRNFIIYTCVTIFCLIFGIIYEFYSHGVISYYMLFGFFIPMLLGMLVFLSFWTSKTKKGPGVAATYLYNSGVATLTVGTYFKGFLEIYGTTREIYNSIFLVSGLSLLGLGILIYLISLIKNR